jgi:alkylation response protein AidB-like acyl-CoA dehydrogenase
MALNPITQSLSLVNRFAQLEFVHKLGLYGPAQKAAKAGTREGFKLAAVVARQFKSAEKFLKPTRLEGEKKRPVLFDVSVTEEQAMMREMAQRFAGEVMRPAAHEADTSCNPPEGFAAQFQELELTQFAVPEALGGAATGAWEGTQTLVYEDLARGDMGLAVAALAPVGFTNVLVRWGSAEQQAKYLPAMIGDEPPVVSIAVSERRPAFDPTRLKTRATLDPDGFTLTGEKTLVPLVAEAEVFIVAADLVGKGPQLFIVEAGTPGVTVKAERGMGVRASGMGAVSFDNVRLNSHALLGEDLGVVDYQEFVDRAQLAWCSLALGTSQAVLEYVIEYANDRVAFGEPISNRQAVAFLIANIAIELEGMRLVVWRAASRAEHGLSFHREAYLARTLCQEKAMEIGTNGVQLLGGHGYTKEHPVEHWYRDLMAIGITEGGLQL